MKCFPRLFPDKLGPLELSWNFVSQIWNSTSIASPIHTLLLSMSNGRGTKTESDKPIRSFGLLGRSSGKFCWCFYSCSIYTDKPNKTLAMTIDIISSVISYHIICHIISYHISYIIYHTSYIMDHRSYMKSTRCLMLTVSSIDLPPNHLQFSSRNIRSMMSLAWG